MSLAPTEHVDVDVTVLGSGFAGSLMALCLKRQGRTVALIERGRHPRFAIGESSTPLANLLLAELADRYDLPRIRLFSKWGTWQRSRPDVAAGLKRGFTFLFHQHHQVLSDDDTHGRQLLVAASPHDEIADTHWYRADFDEMLVQEAEREGVLYLDDTEIQRLEETGAAAVLQGMHGRRPVRIETRFVVDASGPRGCLYHILRLDVAPTRWLPPTHGLYTHFSDVARWDTLTRSNEHPPYPYDDAALHHVFPGGWIWVLRFNNGVTSAGAALTDPVAQAIGAAEGHAAWGRLLAMLPSVHAQFQGARAVRPFSYSPHLAFRVQQVCGRRWALLPSATGLIDPLLSTGIALTLLGVDRLLNLLDGTADGTERVRALEAYARLTQQELDATEQLVSALYASMTDVPLFKRLSLLYFAAASYSEAARRLGRPELAPGFLLSGHPQFGPLLRACAGLAAAGPRNGDRDALLAQIDRAIRPFDTAGLLDPARRDWYPVLATDLLAGAGKLNATREEMERLLQRSGFVPATAQSAAPPAPR
jgi:tetracycline 7-halogenase / FADH2 O2-dependent halogenase